MYLAHYDLLNKKLSCGAIAFEGMRTGQWLPGPWLDTLLASPGVDFAIRFGRGGDRPGVCLLVSAEEDGHRHLKPLLGHLATHGAPGRRVHVADTASTYDALVRDIPEGKLWLSHRGYRAGRETVVSDFRLFPLLGHFVAGQDRGQEFVYQINVRPYESSREDHRQVRKYIAAQQIDSAFPEPMRDLQIAIASRLLEGHTLIDEFLAVNADDVGLVRRFVDSQFQEAMRGLGFRSAPLESEGFDELLVTGRHSTRFDRDTHFLVRAADCLRRGESERLLRSGLHFGAGMEVGTSSNLASAPCVFISYSSNDFASAAEICRNLEGEGIPCWIAPRDIHPGEAYPDAIMRGIESTRAMVVVLSESSNLSPHVHREIERALHRNALIVPMRIQEVVPTGSMEYLLGTLQWIEAHLGQFEGALQELSRRLRFLIEGDSA